MVTSTSTPGSILMEVICLTVSEGLCRSMSRLWILIWNRSHVLEPSPQGVFLIVILRVLVGIRTGPFTLRFFSFAPLIKSAHTFSRDFTLRLVRVILIQWMATSGSTGVLPVSLKAIAAARLPDLLVARRERTAVSQEQEQAALSSRSAATTSSSNSYFLSLISLATRKCKLSLQWKYQYLPIRMAKVKAKTKVYEKVPTRESDSFPHC